MVTSPSIENTSSVCTSKRKKKSCQIMPVLFDEFFWHVICHFALTAPFFHSNNRWRFNRSMTKVDNFCLFFLNEVKVLRSVCFLIYNFLYIYCYSTLPYRLFMEFMTYSSNSLNVIIGKWFISYMVFSTLIYPSP